MPESRATPNIHKPAQIDTKASLFLQNKSGENVELKASQLEQFLTHVKSLPSTNKADEDIAQQLSETGLQDALDVIEFLNTPEGIEKLTLINKELAELAAINEHNLEITLEQLRMEKRRFAHFLLGLLGEREAHAHELNEDAERIVGKILHDGSKSSTQAQATAPKANEQLFDAYTARGKEIEQTLQDKFTESQVLEDKLAKIEHQTELMETKYAIYDDHLDESYLKIAQLTGEDSIEQLRLQIQRLSQQINDDAVRISNLVEINESRARSLMEQSNADNLEMLALEDKLAVLLGEKVVFKEIDGDYIEVDPVAFAIAEELAKDHMLVQMESKQYLLHKSQDFADLSNTQKDDAEQRYAKYQKADAFADADLILDKEFALQHKIVKKDGKYYMLQKDQQFDKMSEGQKDDAEQLYHQLKPEVMGIKKLAQLNHGLERQGFAAQKEPLFKKSDVMQEDIMRLTNQLAQVQAARANIESSIKSTATSPTAKMTPLQSTPTPTPTIRPQPTAKLTSQQCFTQSYKHMLLLMQRRPTQDSIKELRKIFAGDPDPRLQAELKNLKAYTPIPPVTMKYLLQKKSQGTQWLDVRVPDFEERNIAPAASTAPTPFSMRRS